MLFIAVYYRRACAVPDTDTVIIIGGWHTLTTVSRYSVQGWKEDLPNLITGRHGCACTSYISAGRRVRTLMWDCMLIAE